MKYIVAENSWKNTRRFESDSISDCLDRIAQWAADGGIIKHMLFFEDNGEQGWLKKDFRLRIELG